MATSASREGITWHFGGDYTVGDYVLGDKYVYNGGGSVIVNSTTPAQQASPARNGSVKNPGTILAPDGYYFRYQGYDDRYRYDSGQRVTFPVVLSPGDSLVTTESRVAGLTELDPLGQTAGVTKLKRAQVLTCVGSIPFADELRPSYVGGPSYKRTFRTSDINWGFLPNFTTPTGANAPNTQAVYELLTKNPWLAHLYKDIKEHIIPTENQIAYGERFAGVLSEIMSWLCCNFSQAVKERALWGVLQFATDHFPCHQIEPSVWLRDGGYSGGFMSVMHFAGRLLGDPDMAAATFTCPENGGWYEGDSPDEPTLLPTPPDTYWADAYTLYWDTGAAPFTYPRPPTYGNILYSVSQEDGGGSYRIAHQRHHPANWQNSPPYPQSSQYGYGLEGYTRIQEVSAVGMAFALRAIGADRHDDMQAFLSGIDRWMHEDDSIIRAICLAEDPSYVFSRPGGAAWDTQDYNGYTAQFVAALYNQERAGLATYGTETNKATKKVMFTFSGI